MTCFDVIIKAVYKDTLPIKITMIGLFYFRRNESWRQEKADVSTRNGVSKSLCNLLLVIGLGNFLWKFLLISLRQF